MLQSGLSELVDDAEPLARFLTQSSHFNTIGVKAAVFMPSKHDKSSSVFRHGATPTESLWACGTIAVGNRKIYGAGIVTAANVRAADLEIIADEPPERHANIIDWPWNDTDPDLERARQKEIALVLARDAEMVLIPQ